MLLVLFSIFSLKLLVHADNDQDNSPHWVDVCDGYYLFSEESKNWNNASDNCLLYGSHLLQIDNMPENYCLLEYAQKQGISAWFWHSGNDIEFEGVWRQAEGEFISWTPFWGTQYGQPDGGSAANCLGVNLNGGVDAGRWGDEPCTKGHRYIC